MDEHTDPDVVVLRQDTHGLPVADYVSAIRERLPEQTVAHARTPAQERDLVSSARVVTSVRFDETHLDTTNNLELFAGVAAGTGHLPLDAFAEHGVAVTNASGIHAPNIAEQVIGYLLSMTRRLDTARDRQANHEWRHFQADELKDSTVTVVGLGAIGRAIVQRLVGFEVNTIGVRYTPDKGGPTDEVIGFEHDAFHDALAQTDHLVVAAPLTETTRGLVDADAFTTLQPHATLTNVGRGAIVDTDALVDTIRSNSIRAASLDVTDPEPLPADHPLWDFGNVTITPHNAGHSPAHWDRLADIVAANVRTLDESGPADLKNLVLDPTS